MILLIDNYDSFTYNLKQLIETLGAECRVYRNDTLTLKDVETLAPEKIVLSPGPGDPSSAGICLDVIRHFAGRIPILGVCLGHQAIGQAFRGHVVRAPRPRHGKVSFIQHKGKGLFRELPCPFRAARYHSLVVRREELPSCLEVTAETNDGLIMGLRHREFAIEGVQFHPESIATQAGEKLLANFLELAGGRR